VWSQVTPWGLVTLLVVTFVTAFLRGSIVTRRQYEDVIAQRDKWEQAWVRSQETLATLGTHVDANTEMQRTVERMLSSLMARDRERQ
jgi:hypothetical protein